MVLSADIAKRPFKVNGSFGLKLPEKDASAPEPAGTDSKPNIMGGKHKSLLNSKGETEIDVTCRYHVHTLIHTHPLFGVDFKIPPITIDPKIKKDNILAKLVDIVVKYAKDLANELATNSDNLTKLLGVLFIDKLGPEIAGALICRGAKSQQLQERANEHVKERSSEAREAAREAAAVAVAAAAAATIVAGAAAAGEGILAGLLANLKKFGK
jgi:hypothetical protein